MITSQELEAGYCYDGQPWPKCALYRKVGVIHPSHELFNKFAGGHRFDWRCIGPNSFEVHSVGLVHVCEATSREMAEMICKALDNEAERGIIRSDSQTQIGN
jgi:hypothetical protein